MATMNISLPDALRDYVERQVAERGYGTTSEYVRDLIRRDQQRDTLRAALLGGAASPQLTEADRAWFDGLRKDVRDRPIA
jgi:antitoxin ParD1/3/4